MFQVNRQTPTVIEIRRLQASRLFDRRASTRPVESRRVLASQQVASQDQVQPLMTLSVVGSQRDRAARVLASQCSESTIRQCLGQLRLPQRLLRKLPRESIERGQRGFRLTRREVPQSHVLERQSQSPIAKLQGTDRKSVV